MNPLISPQISEEGMAPILISTEWPDVKIIAAWVGSAPHRLWLDSALSSHPQARLSIVTGDPLAVLRVRGGKGVLEGRGVSRTLEDPYSFLDGWLSSFSSASIEGLEFCGGAVGFLGYESYQDRLPLKTPKRKVSLPEAYFQLVDTGLILDHLTKKAWVFSWGIADSLTSVDRQVARLRCGELVDGIQRVNPIKDPPVKIHNAHLLESKKEYLEKIESIKGAILRGDCYQVNLSQKFSFGGEWNPASIYLKLRDKTPAPQMAFLNLPEGQILSASPEVLMKTDGDKISSFPIKGTRPRGRDLEKDERLRGELWKSKKDAAELLMIVDLIRNDLGKICRYGTVQVPLQRYVESFPQVHHTLARVEGRLRRDISPLMALLSMSPGGSITGAPKLKAMEIIDQLEPHPRGIYTGSIGYVGFNGRSCFNIAIRTALIREKVLEYHAGGGIVFDSEPEKEYLETLQKAEGLLQSFGLSSKDLDLEVSN